MEANKYTRWAEYYDQDPRNLYTDDIAFFLDRASRTGGPVLELACGTGRVTLPLAEKGFHITALDHSQAMLDVFSRKLHACSSDVRSRVSLVRGDMVAFDFDERFPFIFIPFRSFQALSTRSAQENCLACVHRHLAPGGSFILDAFRPKVRLDESWVRPKQEDWTTVDKQTQRTLTRYSTQRAIDTTNQVLDIEMSFVLSDESGVIDAFTEPLRLAFFYEDQLVSLVEQAGFVVTERLGYYDGTPIENGSELLLICECSD